MLTGKLVLQVSYWDKFDLAFCNAQLFVEGEQRLDAKGERDGVKKEVHCAGMRLQMETKCNCTNCYGAICDPLQYKPFVQYVHFCNMCISALWAFLQYEQLCTIIALCV